MEDEFSGKWLNASVARYYYHPDLIEFDGDKIKRSLLKDSSKNLVITESREDKYNEEISSLVKIENVESNRIRIFRKGIEEKVIVGKESTTSTTRNAIFENDYVRLLPTKSNISESRIQLLKYELKYDKEKLIIEFNNILDKPYIQEINKKLGREGNKILLEKIDETLLISMINGYRRGLVLPIKDVNDERLILYGFPEKPYEVIANRIE